MLLLKKYYNIPCDNFVLLKLSHDLMTLLIWFNSSVIEEQTSECDNNILEKNI